MRLREALASSLMATITAMVVAPGNVSAASLIANNFGGSADEPAPGYEWSYMGYMYDFFNVIRDEDVKAEGGILNMRNSEWHVNRIYNTTAMPDSTRTVVDFTIDALPDSAGATFGLTINDAQGTTLPPSVQGAICVRIEKELTTQDWRLVIGVALAESTIDSGNPHAVELWPIPSGGATPILAPVVGNDYRIEVINDAGQILAYLYDDGTEIGQVFGAFDVSTTFGQAFAPATNQGVASLLLINRVFDPLLPDFLAVSVTNMLVEDTRDPLQPIIIFEDTFDAPLGQPRWHTGTDRRFEPGGTVFGVWPEGLLDSRKPNVNFEARGVSLRAYDIPGQFYSRAPIAHNLRFTNMDLLVKFTLVAGNPVGSEPPAFFGAKIRVAGDETPHFMCAVMPAAGTIAMGPGTGFNTFQQIVSTPQPISEGETGYLLIQADGATVRMGLSKTPDFSDSFAVISTEAASPLGEGFINFAAQNLELVRLDEFAVYPLGMGGFPTDKGFLGPVSPPLPGDVNDDGVVNVADVTDLGLLLSGEIVGPLPNMANADLDGDGSVTEADLELLVDLIVN